MTDIQHKNITEGNIHSPINWKFTTSSDRINANVEDSDVGKIAHQINNNTLWWLISSAPTWKKMLLEGDQANATGTAGGSLQGSYPNPIVKSDSHTHTLATLPAYPTTLPPTGTAGGDLEGAYPNPIIKPTGVVAGQYAKATVTVNEKGLITNIESTPDNGIPVVTTPEYDNDTDNIATTKYVTRGGINYPILEENEELILKDGYIKQVHKSYNVKGKLVVIGNLYITDDEQPTDKPNFTTVKEVIYPEHFKLVMSGYNLKSDAQLIIKGTLKVI